MIRRLTQSDAEVVAPLARAARAVAMPGFPEQHDPDEDISFYRGQIETGTGFAHVDEEGRIDGFILGRPHSIDHLYVAVGSQGQGRGSTLLQALCEALPERPLRLWTFQSNARAVSFYTHHGWVIVDATDGAGNEEGLPDYQFELG